MTLITTVPALQAHSALRYADWRSVVAEYVARRRGESAAELIPQAVQDLPEALVRLLGLDGDADVLGRDGFVGGMGDGGTDGGLIVRREGFEVIGQDGQLRREGWAKPWGVDAAVHYGECGEGY